jgi:glucose/arabinose dehydrogenase
VKWLRPLARSMRQHPNLRRLFCGGRLNRISDPGAVVTELPAGRINHHWTKNLVAGPDGRFLYVSIGSNSNAGENGLPAEEDRAQIWEMDPRTGRHRSYATGLRNPNGLSFAPGPAPVLWTAVNERDALGSDLVPDYMASARDGGFYGWPFSYYGQHVDDRVKPQRPDLVARAVPPDYALGATPPRWDWLSPRTAVCRRHSLRALSLASMAPGIAGHRAAIA